MAQSAPFLQGNRGARRSARIGHGVARRCPESGPGCAKLSESAGRSAGRRASGRGLAWLGRSTGGAEVASSNLAVPTRLHRVRNVGASTYSAGMADISARRQWTDIRLTEAVAASRSWRGVMRQLGLCATSTSVVSGSRATPRNWDSTRRTSRDSALGPMLRSSARPPVPSRGANSLPDWKLASVTWMPAAST